MEKDRRRRYETASAFAADIVRYRRNEPVEAGAPSAWYRARKFARRHRLGLIVAAIVALSSAVVAWMWVDSAVRLDRARRTVAESRTEVELRALEARRHRYVADIRQAFELVQSGQTPHVLELLDKWQPSPGGPDVRNFAWYYVLRLCHDERRTLRGHKGAVYHAEFSPDGRTLVSCGRDGTVRFWEVATGRCLRTIEAHGDEVNDAAFSPDGRSLATAGDDGAIKVWDVETGVEHARISAHKGDAIAVRFSPDGQRLISAGRNDFMLKLWDRATQKELASKRAHELAITGLVQAPDGKTIATTSDDGYAKLWNIADLTLKKSIPCGRDVYGLAFSSDGSQLATADAAGRVRTWDRSSGNPKIVIAAHGVDAQAVAFLDGDRLLVSGDGHGCLRMSDAGTGKILDTLNGHIAKIWGITVSPDGTTFATVSSDGTLRLWDARLPQRWVAASVWDGTGTWPLAFTPDGQALVSAGCVGGKLFLPKDGGAGHYFDTNLEVRGIDPKTGAKLLHRILAERQKCSSSWLAEDGATVVFVRPDDSATAWDVATGRKLTTFDSIVTPGRFQVGYAHPPGEPIEVVDLGTGQRHALRGTESAALVTSAAAAGLVALRDGNELTIWDLAADRKRRARRGVGAAWSAAKFSPDATILAAAESSPMPGPIRLWDVKTLELIDSLEGHSASVKDMDFSPDGKVLASVGSEGAVKLWDVAARVELFTLRLPFSPIPPLRFAPDGRSLAFIAPVHDKNPVVLLQTTLPDDLAPEQ
jgi:WD40 repeat protein